MKIFLFSLFTVIFTITLCAQDNSVEIKVKNEAFTTGDIFSNLNSREVYNGDIRAGSGEIFVWADMRGWAEFTLPSELNNKKITSLKLKFNVVEESSANNNATPGSHNLIITKFPFDVRDNSLWDIIEYFDKLNYEEKDKIYGENWTAGESVGIKEVTLDAKAISDLYSSIKDNKIFKVGFWEFNDNASRCIISGNSSNFPPSLIVSYK